MSKVPSGDIYLIILCVCSCGVPFRMSMKVDLSIAAPHLHLMMIEVLPHHQEIGHVDSRIWEPVMNLSCNSVMGCLQRMVLLL